MPTTKPQRRKSCHGAPAAFLADVLTQRPSGCVIWPFARAGKGYGHLREGGRMVYAHRKVCEAIHGPAPHPDSHAAHSCGRGFDGCISPDHIFWKSPAANAADKFVHDTHNRGERHGLSKLTEQSVRYIRAHKTASLAELARLFGVSPKTIRRVRDGETWSWLA